MRVSETDRNSTVDAARGISHHQIVGLSSDVCVSNWEFSRRIQDSATLRGARRLTYADPHMRNLLLALLHLAVVTAKLCGSGGVRAVMAENLLLKQQLIVLRRARKRAPNLTLERPAAVRILVDLPQSRTHPKGCDCPSALDASGISSSLGPSQIPSAVLIEAVSPRSPDRKGRMRRSFRPSSNSRHAIRGSVVHGSR